MMFKLFRYEKLSLDWLSFRIDDLTRFLIAQFTQILPIFINFGNNT